MGLDAVDLALLAAWHEDDVVVHLEYAGLDLADWGRAHTPDGVDLLYGDPEGLVGWLGGHHEGVECLEECRALVPGHVGALLDEVVAAPAAGGDEVDLARVVADHLEEAGDAVLDLLVALLAPGDGRVVHLVDGDDDLVNAQGLGEEGVLTRLASGVGS